MSKGKLLAVCFIWVVAVAAMAGAYRFLIYEPDRKHVFYDTGSDSNYKHTIGVAHDSFSGYAVLRSPELRDQLAKRKIRLRFENDDGDYAKRLETLQSGQTPMAVFTIDGLLKVCEKEGSLPGTIVAVIDETRGADAVVAYKKAVPNIDALNRTDMKFVLMPDTPSETLARVVMSHFKLDNLGANPFVTAKDPDAVYKAFRKSSPTAPQAFVLWEPYVTKVLGNKEAHIVADSSQFRGYIVDVVVVNRDYLVNNPAVVREVLAAYFRAAYHYRDNMVQLVVDDAKEQGTPLSLKQAESVVKGIRWKNTQENFAHFGISNSGQAELLEDMISKITHVLTTTGAIQQDPTSGEPTSLFYDKLVKELQSNNFHPDLAAETIREEHQIKLPKLSDAQWQKLVPVGTLDVPRLVFARGTDRLNSSSRASLDDLVDKLQSLPRSYVIVKGNASRAGNLEANKALARKRAVAAASYLRDAGVDQNRIRPVAGNPSGATSVDFVLGQPPY